jgi:deazaflavin-dependent oxidoreductase (nitroreductase family)
MQPVVSMAMASTHGRLKGRTKMPDMKEFNQGVIKDFRANGGKVGGQMANIPLLLVTMKGAKSGRTITLPLAYSKDGNRCVVIASYAGAPHNPSWYHNLVAHPDVTIELGGEKFQAKASVAQGAERDRLYKQQADQLPIFNEYQKKTTRRIPVIVLDRVN